MRNQDQADYSARDMYLAIVSQIKYLLSNWLVIALVCVLFSVLFVILEYRKPITYTSKISFILNEDEGGRLSLISGVLGQFGLGGAKSKSNLDRVLYLSSTSEIISNTLHKKSTVDNKSDYFINHFLKVYEYNDIWPKRDLQHLVNYEITDTTDLNSDEYQTVLKDIYYRIAGSAGNKNPILRKNIDEDPAVLSLMCTTPSEDLSVNFTDSLFTTLSDFYINNGFKKSKTAYDILKNKSDSVGLVLDGKISALNQLDDNYRGAVYADYTSAKRVLSKDIQVLTLTYGELIKNLEIASIDVEDKEPYIVITDKTISPITPDGGNLILGFLKGIIVGVFISCMYLLIRNLIKE